MVASFSSHLISNYQASKHPFFHASGEWANLADSILGQGYQRTVNLIIHQILVCFPEVTIAKLVIQKLKHS